LHESVGFRVLGASAERVQSDNPRDDELMMEPGVRSGAVGGVTSVDVVHFLNVLKKEVGGAESIPSVV
jgi:hypothetical protein